MKDFQKIMTGESRLVGQARGESFWMGVLVGVLIGLVMFTAFSLTFTIKGDMNGDGKLDARDLLIMKRQILSIESQTVPTGEVDSINALYPPPTTGVQP